MKISKSKQELARIISENGGWRDGAESAAQCIEGEISFWHDTATKQPGENWCGNFLGEKHDIEFIGFKLPNWHQTILSRDEYFHLYPAPDADGWIEWKGGDQPVKDGVKVDVKYKTSGTNIGVRAGFTGRLNEGSMSGYSAVKWSHTGSRTDIIAYRLHKPEQSKHEPAKVEEAKPTIEQLAADYRNAKDYAGRKQQEADDAKADADEKLRVLELAGEALGLLVSPITAKQEPELATVQVGDEVECIKSNVNPSKYMGMSGTVLEVDDSSTPYLVDFGGVERIWCHKVKFIRRP